MSSIVDAEQVLVVPTSLFHSLGYFQGFSTDVDRYLSGLLDSEHVSYRPRHEMEDDPSFKQLIPYVVFRHTDPAGSQSLFQYTRGTGQGEGRLHSKRSVGIGGHISSIDAGLKAVGPNADGFEARNPYQEGMRRELDEEVIIRTPYVDRCVGLINDDETEVGRVHLGVVHVFEVETPDVEPRESEILEAGFQRVDQLLADLSRFESWSQICLKALFAQP